MTGKSYTLTGMMSGTSLDGIDLVLCRFYETGERWRFEIHKAKTFPYSSEWKSLLQQAPYLDARSFIKLHEEYGRYIADSVLEFLSENRLKVDLVASHGHTIFHQPQFGFTFQLGSGAAIAAGCHITVVSDFRSLDVALGGQGAPLVPVGDELLFGNYKFCLNLGGFANISNVKDSKRVACDLCPVNYVANLLAQRAGFEYDRNGELGRMGNIISILVHELNNLEFYAQNGPKSLGREWVESVFLPVVDKYKAPVSDLIRSIYEHVAVQISNYTNRFDSGEILVTGGGAFNTYLMELMRQRSKSSLVVPDAMLVKYKEALVFAFLGLLRFLNRTNCYASVTGAGSDSSSGVVFTVDQ
jgi:anhydro-N-acetylmuramic acid kinase